MRGRVTRLRWSTISHDLGEVCNLAPGVGEDLVVVVNEPLTFARGHLGLVDWAAAVRAGAIQVSGPPALCRALPTWNASPQLSATRRREAAAPRPQAPIRR